MKTVLTIAGSDSGGGAGIQADIKTMTAHGVFATTAITAITAQNTLGVAGVMECSAEMLKMQLDCVFQDLFPDAVKIGMVSSGTLIQCIAEKLKQYHAKNIVLDPVMVSTSGSSLMQQEALYLLKEQLIPLATVITPNIPEAEVLTNRTIRSEEDMLAAGKNLYETFHCNVLVKGGHSVEKGNDLLINEKGYRWFRGERIENPNTHGTGCTLSSAIASNLAKNDSLEDAIAKAKEYISGALSAQMNLGQGSGPLHHGFDLKSKFI